MLDRRRGAVRGSLLVALMAPAACTVSPFRTTDAERGVSVARERIETVEPLGIDRYAVEPEGEGGALERPEDPFEYAEEVPVTLERARAWTLRNNLDLKVSLVDPTIANADLAEEEAAWEWTFLANGTLTNTDTPTATTLAGNSVENQNLSLGVRIPTRTGGTIDVNLPFNRTETDNQFSTLNPSFPSDIEVSISQPLLRNAGRRTNTHALRIQALQTQITEARTKLEVIRQLANVDRAYWNVYATQEALRVAYEQYQLAYEQLEVARRRYRAKVDPRLEVVRAFTLPENLAGSRGHAGTAPTAQADLDLRRNGASIGSVTFAAGVQTASFSLAGGAAFAPGDRLELIAPATQDATLAGLALTFLGNRS